MKATIIYGPSGSGKTTYVKEGGNKILGVRDAVHLERDHIRFSILNLGNWEAYKPNNTTENLVDTYWKYFLLKAAIVDRDDLIISDTLCKANERQKTIDLLKGLGYTDIQLIRMDTPLVECIRRDALRGDMSVGEDVIRKQREHFIKG